MKKALELEGSPDVEVSLLLVSDEHMRRLNHRFRGMKETTDVLAFPMQEGRFTKVNPELLGDVAISVERAREQARSYSQEFHQELSRLAIHGLLHLLGYKDSNQREKARMVRRGEEILKEAMGGDGS